MRIIRPSSIVCLIILLSFTLIPAVVAEDVAGSLSAIEGPVTVVRDRQKLKGSKGMPLMGADLLRTGKAGSATVRFTDGTKLSLGPNAVQPLESLLALPVGDVSEDAEGVVGSIKTLRGLAVIRRAGKDYRAVIGTRLLQHDVIRTDPNGAAGIMLRDDTTLSIGPSSELSMKEYVFEPSTSTYAMVVGFAEGTFSYVSGLIGKLSPESVRVETPVGNVTVRGTKFMARIKK